MIRKLLLTLALAAGLAASALAQTDAMTDLRAGNASFKEGRYDEAVQAYTRAIISGQLGAEALAVTFNNRGVAYGELGDFDRAIIDYNEALGLRPDDATSIRNLRVGHVKRGVSEANLGERDKALADFTKAIELDPSHYLAYLRRGQLRGDAGDLDAAIADLEKAQNLAPDNAQVAELLTRTRQVQADGRAAAERPAATAAVEPAAPPPEPTAQAPAPADAAAAPAPATPAPAAPPAPQPEAAPAAVAAAPAERQPAAQRPAAPQAEVAATSGERLRIRQAVNMRAGPGNDFERMTTLPAGTVGTVTGENLGWFQLEISGGRRGWVYKRFLEPAS
ncbi:MAG TPA: tetratricopeptide repeat protein [Geminicoccaceae bacterium]|nr:tetratricopeptide repeat protein [Geminicoccus sp.]HMU50398.1 tetratricopeptide repeat protein [Geminicoccaceae bacterium]